MAGRSLMSCLALDSHATAIFSKDYMTQQAAPGSSRSADAPNADDFTSSDDCATIGVHTFRTTKG